MDIIECHRPSVASAAAAAAAAAIIKAGGRVTVSVVRKSLPVSPPVCVRRVRRRQYPAQDHIDDVLPLLRVHSSGHCARRAQL